MRIPRRLPIPPAWRSLASGQPDTWTLVAIGAALLGGAFLLNPAASAERLARFVGDRRPPAPNRTGQAMGYTNRTFGENPYVDPFDVLAGRAAVRSALDKPGPMYVGSGMPEYVRPDRPYGATAPIRAQDLRNLARPQPSLGPIPRGDASRTAADAFSAQAARNG